MKPVGSTRVNENKLRANRVGFNFTPLLVSEFAKNFILNTRSDRKPGVEFSAQLINLHYKNNINMV